LERFFLDALLDLGDERLGAIELVEVQLAALENVEGLRLLNAPFDGERVEANDLLLFLAEGGQRDGERDQQQEPFQGRAPATTAVASALTLRVHWGGRVAPAHFSSSPSLLGASSLSDSLVPTLGFRLAASASSFARCLASASARLFASASAIFWAFASSA